MSKQTHNIEELLLDYLDGTLDKNKQAFVERYLANNPQIAEELAGLKDITLVPNEEIIYGNKDNLKKTKVFRLPLYTKYAAAASGALLIGLFLWFSIDNNPVKLKYANNITPKLETLKPENIIKKESSYNVAIISPGVVSHKTKSLIKHRAASNNNIANVPSIKKYRKRVAEPGEEEQQMAAVEQIKVNQAVLLQNTVLNKEDILASLEAIPQKEIESNSLWQTPIIVNESRMMLVTEPRTLRSRFEALLPNELAKVEARVKNTIKEVGTDNIKDKIKSAFHFNSLKEALVPSSVQETITSIQ